MIEDLRAELLAAMQEGVGKELRFRLKPIELELSLVVTKDASLGGKVRFWVVDVNAEGKFENSTTQTLKLVLEPVGKDGKSSSEQLISSARAKRT
jgi:hypothetical protein